MANIVLLDSKNTATHMLSSQLAEITRLKTQNDLTTLNPYMDKV